MTLDDWLAKTATTPHALHILAGVSISVIPRAREGRAAYRSAYKIHVATGRKVPIASMTKEPSPEAEAEAAIKRARR